MNKIFAYFGHHKCATTYINFIIKDVCKLLNVNHSIVNSNLQFDNDLHHYIDSKKINFLSYTNADYKFTYPILKNVVGFHIIRDPRDIIVSAYFSHLNSHPIEGWSRLENYRNELKKLPINLGLEKEIKHSKTLMNHLSDWDYTNKNILEIKFENMILNPYETFITIFKHLNLINLSAINNSYSIKYTFAELTNNLFQKFFKFQLLKYEQISIEKLLFHVYNNRFEKISGDRKVGVKDNNNHFRNGLSGDWKNYFTPSHKELFN